MSAPASSSSSPRVLLVGGGVASLAVALRLARLNWEITILEADPGASGRGHGLLLPPAASADLEALGVAPRDFGMPLEGFELCHRDGSNRRLFALEGCCGVLRRDLMDALQTALPTSVHHHRGRCLGLEVRTDGTLQVITEDEGARQADLIVAADGVASPCRRSLFPGARLTPERVTELVLDLVAPGAFTKLHGHCVKFEDPSAGLALGLMPCRPDRVVIYAQLATARYPLPSPLDGTAVLHRLFMGWNDWLDAWLDAIPGAQVHRWRTTDLDPLPRLHRGNVVLVGDAAHPLLPFTSQGVPAALADALALGHCLEGVDPRRPADLATALARYSDRRLPAMAQLIDQGRQLQHQFLVPDGGDGSRMPPLAGYPSRPVTLTTG
ncbi:MAG: NAD(P)/FAD-dependent oxidoreductase [Cyanobacteriota bacterium]|nr:NAD(P)/FAD-dependent oxidoreductase [Cyanobacteriota bacterium]